jgi:DNA-binding NtrC family response regulator
MLSVPVSVQTSSPARSRSRTVLVASADRSFRQRISETLTGLRWQVREAEGGAQAWSESEAAAPEAIIVDSWLPDLELNEFVKEFRGSFPNVDVVAADGETDPDSPRGPYRQELLYALRRSQDSDTAAWNSAPALSEPVETPVRASSVSNLPFAHSMQASKTPAHAENPALLPGSGSIQGNAVPMRRVPPTAGGPSASLSERLPELVGDDPCMLEVSRRVRLVAPRMAPVLIEGPTGSGKELVAEALHRLSTRSRKPFVALNCAAIPESLLEAELFGHTRGAFTGAVQGRVGRIEAADGGTLFLDEIGEMPLALQSKLLRFVECGELQRVGDNETVKVDVRIIAATHRHLAQQTQTGGFRADLYYRLAVFLIRTPALAEHPSDLSMLVDHFLARLGREAPVKCIEAAALSKLAAHDWPGNVRELEHVLERAVILAGDEPVVSAQEIDFGLDIN